MLCFLLHVTAFVVPWEVRFTAGNRFVFVLCPFSHGLFFLCDDVRCDRSIYAILYHTPNPICLLFKNTPPVTHNGTPFFLCLAKVS